MATTITSAGTLFQGDNSAELVTIDSGAATRTTIYGSGGNDSINFIVSSDGGVTSLIVDAQGDRDEITFSGSDLYDSTLKGGAGADTITIATFQNFDGSELLGGDGNDLLTFSGAAASGGSVIAGGSGSDTLTLGFTKATAIKIAAGSGADSITLGDEGAYSAITIFGGGGADDVILSGNIGVGSLVNLDSTVDGGGADTLILRGNVSNSATIKGKGGKDEIIVESILNSAQVLGNAGADDISANAFGGAFSFIGGGSGNDTLNVAGQADAASSNSVIGGGGADYVDVGTGNAIGGTGIFLYGGLGADTIDLGAGISGEAAGLGAGAATGYVAYASLAESSLASMDTLTGAAAGVTGASFSFDTAAGIKTFTVGAFADSDSSTIGITAGVVSGATWTSADSSVTSRAAEIDSLVTTKGTLVGFNANSVEYLFIQGGASGTSDDAVIEVFQAVSGFEVANNYEFFARFAD